MKKIATVVFLCLFIVLTVKATEKLRRRVRVTQVNEWQAIVSCRNGRTPTVNQKAIAGVVVVSCEGREEGDE